MIDSKIEHETLTVFEEFPDDFVVVPPELPQRDEKARFDALIKPLFDQQHQN